MIPKTVELEGTWEQIAEQASHYPGHRMRLTILSKLEDQTSVEGDAQTIEEKIAAYAANVPDEEWANLPTDMGVNLDHYIYGTAKRT